MLLSSFWSVGISSSFWYYN